MDNSDKTTEYKQEISKLENLLKRTAEEADRANNAKNEFLSKMSHEMRTPMNAIFGMTNIAKSSKDINKIYTCLDKIDIASKQLLKIINDVLDMSRIESDKMEIGSEVFSIEELLREISADVSAKAHKKNQSFQISADKNLSKFYKGDPAKITQVLNNLFSNAVKYSPENANTVLNIFLVRNQNNVSTLKFELSDEGIGMSKEQVDNLFKPFTQGESGLNRKYGGTGLGLTISKKLVALMGGDLSVESKLNGGSKFTFTINLENAETGELKPGRLENMDDLNVLAVDDSPDVLMFFRDLLGDYNINCSAAPSGGEAVEMAKASVAAGTPFTIAFVDYKMPVLNGVETAKLLKRIIPQLHIVFISVFDVNTIINEAGDVIKFLPKPLFTTSVINTINGFLPGKDKIAANENSVIYDFSGKCALIAEDIEINKEIIISLLEKTNIKMRVVSDGEAAVAEFKNGSQYDVVLMDIQMPVKDGYTAVKEIRALDFANAKSVPIIAMTASVFPDEISKAFASGMNDHIAKPVNNRELMEKMRVYLAKNTKKDTYKDENSFLPYLNLNKGLARVRDNKALYVKLLKNFLNILNINAIKENLKDNNVLELDNAVQALKGTSSNLSVEKLAESVEAFELAVKNNGDLTDSLIDIENCIIKTRKVINEAILFLGER